MFRYVLVSCLLLAGCASTATSTKYASSTTQPASAQCLVCKKNADLACVEISVEPTTPRYMYNGATYYFCSDDCKNEFAKSPQKYLKK